LIITTRGVPHSDGVGALRGPTRGNTHSDGVTALIVTTRGVPHSSGVDALRSPTCSDPHSDGVTALIRLTRVLPHSDGGGALRGQTSIYTNTHLPISIIRFNENFTTHQNITCDIDITRKCLDIRRRHMLLLQYNFFDWVSIKKIIGADVKMVC
jgi:hypothetical protein